MSVRAAAAPALVTVDAGQPASFELTVTNASEVIDAYDIGVFGIDPEWITTTPERLSLFPGDTSTITVYVEMPVDCPSSQRPLSLNVRSLNDPAEFALARVDLAVAPRPQLALSVDPNLVTAGKQATYGLVVENLGNLPFEAVPYGLDPEDKADFRCEPDRVTVPVGDKAVVRVTAKGGRAWFGQLTPREFALGVNADEPVEVPVVFLQRPRIGRIWFLLLGLLAAALVFGFVLKRAFDNVVEKATVVDSAVIEQALNDQGDDSGGLIPVDPVSARGQITSTSTQEGTAGLEIELFLVGDTVNPAALAVTDAEGAFEFGGLRARDTNNEDLEYVMKISGAGFDSLWYPNGETAADAEKFSVPLEKPFKPIVIGGRPGSVAGKVVDGDPVGAIARLVVPSAQDPGKLVLAAEVPVSADGSFIFEGVQAPANYQLRVSKLGFATEERNVEVDAAEALDGIEINLRPGDGIITGTVFSGGVPLRTGAVVAASDANTSVTTVSLTEGAAAEIGTFTLRNLPVPGRYTVTITADGFASETLSVLLNDDPLSEGNNFQLRPAVGSVSGIVNLLDPGASAGTPAGGVTVSISGSNFEAVTTSVNVGGEIGSFRFSPVPVPGAYTVTFTREDYLPQVQLVQLDARANVIDLSNVTATLLRETGIIRGTVVRPRNRVIGALSRVEVEITDGSPENTFRVLTADDDGTPGSAGRFEVSGLPPGSYTVRSTPAGSIGAARVVSLLPASVQEISLNVGPQAVINGVVTRNRAPLGPGVTATVRLIPLENFPLILEGSTQVCTTPGGSFTFVDFEADQSYMVAVFDSTGLIGVQLLDSVQVDTRAGVEVDLAELGFNLDVETEQGLQCS